MSGPGPAITPKLIPVVDRRSQGEAGSPGGWKGLLASISGAETVLNDGKASVGLALKGAAKVQGIQAGNFVVYKGAIPDGDLISTATASAVEDFVVFEKQPTAAQVQYTIRLPDASHGLRLVSNILEVIDSTGNPVDRMSPPFLVDTAQHVADATVSVGDCAIDTNAALPWGRPVTAPGASQCTVTISWSDPLLHYPAILDPAWVSNTTLATARYAAATITQFNNYIITLGGYSTYNNAVLSSVEVFNGASWSTWKPLPAARAELAAVYDPNQFMIYVSGGTATYLGGATNSFWKIPYWLYGSSSGWTNFNSSGMIYGRKAHAMFIEPTSHQVINIGGCGQDYASCNGSSERINASGAPAGTTNNLAAGAVGYFAAMTCRINGTSRIVVTGGYTNTAPSGVVQTFDPSANVWTQLGSVTARYNHAAACADNGNLYTSTLAVVAGGSGAGLHVLLSDVQTFNLSTNLTYTANGALPRGVDRLSAVALPYGDVLFAGGHYLIMTQPGTYVNYWGADVTHYRYGLPGTATAINAMPNSRAQFGLVSVVTGSNTNPVVHAVAGYPAGAVDDALTLVAPGASCTSANDCLTPYCTTGKCCFSDCAGVCNSCGVDGNCRALAAGTACGGGYTCDGTAATCPTSCSTDAGCISADGCGTDHVCYTRQANGSACTQDAQCQGFCLYSTVCAAKEANGTTETNASHCVSGAVSDDGVCCDVACHSPCNSCSTAHGASSNGTCTKTNTQCYDNSYGTPCSANTACAPSTICSGGVCTCPSATKYCMADQYCIPSGACCSDSDCAGQPAPPNNCLLSSSCVDHQCSYPKKCGGTSTCTSGICTCPSGTKYCASFTTCVPNAYCCADIDCSSSPPDSCGGAGGKCELGSCQYVPACTNGTSCISGTCQYVGVNLIASPTAGFSWPYTSTFKQGQCTASGVCGCGDPILCDYNVNVYAASIDFAIVNNSGAAIYLPPNIISGISIAAFYKKNSDGSQTPVQGYVALESAQASIDQSDSNVTLQSLPTGQSATSTNNHPMNLGAGSFFYRKSPTAKGLKINFMPAGPGSYGVTFQYSFSRGFSSTLVSTEVPFVFNP